MIRCAVADAPAKVNLFLRVLHRRPDGYRELETLFQTISLSDRVEVSLGENPPAEEVGAVTLDVAGPDLGLLADNLAYRAAAAFVAAFDLSQAVAVRLEKHIPAGAGLGGGSSDAAAVLRCLAVLTGHDAPEVLDRIAVEIGSDVPFFVSSQPLALGRGRGEVLTPLPPLSETHLVLALPPAHVATAAAYARLADQRAEELGDGGADPHGGPRSLALDGGLSREELTELMENDFESVVRVDIPEVAASLDALRSAGAEAALLSGSGAASFGIFPDAVSAQQAADELTSALGWAFRAVTTRRSPASVEIVGRGGR